MSSAAEPPPTNVVDIVKSIINLGGDAAAALSSRQQVKLINSLVGYCIHIARDQDALAKRISSGKEPSRDDLSFSELPAMRELLTNPALFQCIISMLSYNNNSTSNNNGTSAYQQSKRKRSPSEDLTHAASRKKPMMSPNPIGQNLYPKRDSKTGNIVGDNKGSKGQLSMQSLPVYAATILYSVLQHVEHWPVQIMKAFAEDSFGSRIWVDDERCKAFVSNLEQSLKTREMNGSSTDVEEAEAYWETMMEPPTSSAKSNGSVSSSVKTKSPSSKEKRKETKNTINGDDDDGSSSSSGEEEVLEAESQPQLSKKEEESSTLSLPSLFRIMPMTKERVRPRYYMHSLESTYELISDAFQDRLNSKSKQNYRLLQVLPAFLPIPRVRCLASRHLERWLQSPALAGLARTLFAHLVKEVRCIEPPLPDDIEIIDNVLKLNLKTNQLSMHIEHITMIAKQLPTLLIAQMIFTHCIDGERATGSVSNAIKPNDDHLRILCSVYAVLDRKLAANALASCISTLTSDVLNQAPTTDEFNTQLHNISSLLCAIVDALGNLYDGYQFVKAIINAQSITPKTITSVNITARLIFECTLLVARTVPSLQNGLKTAISQKANKKSSFSEFDSIGEEEVSKFRKEMLGLRKSILRWCVNTLCSVYHSKVTKEEQAKCADTYYERGAVKRGPGALNFESVLDVNTTVEVNDDRPSPYQRMMRLIRCMLFLSPPSSKEMATFTATSEEEMDNDRFQRISFCCQYGVDVDDGMLKTIISSPNVTPRTAISVVEELLRCVGNSDAKVDCAYDTVKNMYQLTEFVPEFREKDDNQRNEDALSLLHFANSSSSSGERLDRSKLPRLAITSLWWRVSSIALTLSGILPGRVGIKMWQENPTLRALIKMTTSQKYRFPTADCSNSEKKKVRLAEERMKQEELKIAELLFMPSATPKKPTKPKLNSRFQQSLGRRTSTRQRERQARSQAIEDERQAAALHEENIKIRKVLKTLSKNIMLFDPEQDQRKPVKGSTNLLVSVNHLFDLAKKFRLSTSPDFLLQTIGEGRSAIERAYDWLIPIICSHPDIIDRLQASSSCFLLLRAYAEGEQNRELLDLTAPLLSHVSKCLSGDVGIKHALLALELLLQDVAAENSDQRQCARNVLQKTIGDSNVMDTFQDDLGQCGWSIQIMHVPNSKELIRLAIKYLSKALAFEQGKVLMHYISALNQYEMFLKEHQIDESFDFDAVLCKLIASRPTVCCDAFDRYSDIRALAITKVKATFVRSLESNGGAQTTPDASLSQVVVAIPRGEVNDDQKVTHAIISSDLLHACIILISNWQSNDNNETNTDEESAISQLLRYLVIPYTDKGDSGLSSAWYNHNQKRAVSVEEWVLLAKSRSTNVAKHASQAAPNVFLPRLLLCAGLSDTSFRTMLQRLDNMADDTGKVYNELISPTAVLEWGLLGIEKRRVIKQKLYGRLLAYTRIHTTANTTNSRFLSWLSSEADSSSISTKSITKNQARFTSILGSLKSSFDDTSDSEDFNEREEDPKTILAEEDKKSISQPLFPSTDNITQAFINQCVEKDQWNVLDESLDLVAAKSMFSKDTSASILVAKLLLESLKSYHGNSSFVNILLKWVPYLSQDHGDETLWQLIFSDNTEQERLHLLSLIQECASKWSDEHVCACQAWIFSQQTRWKTVNSLRLVLRFLVLSSDQSKMDDDVDIQAYFSYNEKSATSITHLALQGAIAENTNTNGSSKVDDDISDWLTLILLMAKSHQELVTRLILEKVDETKYIRALSSVLLRLYIMYPLKMSLSDSKLRNTLLQASTDFTWLEWTCPLDGQVHEMISGLIKSPHQRLVQSVTDIARHHPLIFVRHLKLISQKLMLDGTGRDEADQRLMQKGRIFGKNPSEPDTLVAQIGEVQMKVSIVMWGYSFNEYAWTSILDILLTLPNEVIFSCGIKLGLSEVLEAYLRLFDVQMIELQSEKNISGLLDKFNKIVQSFKKCQPKLFQEWANSDDIRPLLTID